MSRAAAPAPPSRVVQMLQRLQQRVRAGRPPLVEADAAVADRHHADRLGADHAPSPACASPTPDDAG